MNALGAVAASWHRNVLRTVRNKAVMVSAVAIPSLFMVIFTPPSPRLRRNSASITPPSSCPPALFRRLCSPPGLLLGDYA